MTIQTLVFLCLLTANALGQDSISKSRDRSKDATALEAANQEQIQSFTKGNPDMELVSIISLGKEGSRYRGFQVTFLQRYKKTRLTITWNYIQRDDGVWKQTRIIPDLEQLDNRKTTPQPYQ